MAVLIFLIVLDFVFIVFVMYFALTTDRHGGEHHVAEAAAPKTLEPNPNPAPAQTLTPAQAYKAVEDLEVDVCRIDNGTFLAYPTNKVLGVVDTAAQVRGAITALEEAGYDKDKLEILCGHENSTLVDPDGSEHGLIGRIIRRIQQFSDFEIEHAQVHQEALQSGRFLVGVPARSQEQAEKARDILVANGGHFINYYMPLAFQPMTP
jgi:hypothetical protein